MKRYILEACVDSVESALAAVQGGADRLELCANLVIGGTTPDVFLYEKVREVTKAPVHVLIRPRSGDFLYTGYEFEIIARNVERFRQLGAEGVVTGCLMPDGSLDVERMARLRELAGAMNMTLHRAFDMCRNPYEVLEQAGKLGVQTILTSGQAGSCVEGKKLIAGLKEQSNGLVDIMAGGGVEAEVIRQMARDTKVTSYHMSGKVTLDSGMTWRRQEVAMFASPKDAKRGSMSASEAMERKKQESNEEYRLLRTDEEKIRAARHVLDELQREKRIVGDE